MLRRSTPPPDLSEFYKTIRGLPTSKLCKLSADLHMSYLTATREVADVTRRRSRVKRMRDAVTKVVHENRKGFIGKHKWVTDSFTRYRLIPVLSGEVRLPTAWRNKQLCLYNKKGSPTESQVFDMEWSGKSVRGLRDIFGDRVHVFNGRVQTNCVFTAVELSQLGARLMSIRLRYGSGRRKFFEVNTFSVYWVGEGDDRT